MAKPVYKLELVDGSYFEIALVGSPAIEKNFQYFNKEKEKKYTFNEEKYIVEGPVMIPNMKIYRYNDVVGDYYVYFDESEIVKCSQSFFENFMTFNAEHTFKGLNLSVIESYFTKEDGLYPRGTWMLCAKVNDTETWSKIKNNEFNGFSIEAYFEQKEVFSKINNKDYLNKFNNMDKEKILTAISELLFGKEEPVVEDKTVEEKAVEEPVNEEQVVEEKAVEEPVNEEPVVEETFTKKDINEIVNKLTEKFTSEIKTLNDKIEILEKEPISKSVTEEFTIVNDEKIKTPIDKFFGK